MQIFSTVNTTILHELWLIKSMDMELPIWRNHQYRRTLNRKGKLNLDLRLKGGLAPLIPILFKGQLLFLNIQFYTF